jgi:hypothetical protein
MLNAAQGALFDETAAEIDAATGFLTLIEVTRLAICALLKRQEDEPHREKMLAAVQKFMMATMNAPGTPSGEKLVNLKKFAKDAIKIILLERPLVARTSAVAPTQTRRQIDKDPDALAGQEPARILALGGLGEPDTGAAVAATEDGDIPREVIKPTTIIIVSPVAAQKFDSFKSLFPAAICYRMERATCFFQRYNPHINRGLSRPFLLSKAFADRLFGVMNDIIVPAMVASSRNVTVLETSRQWAGVTTAEFWEIVDRDERAKIGIVAAWTAAWEGCRQRRETRETKDGKTAAVLVASPILLKVREKLAPTHGEFTLPPIRNDEITLFASMLYELDLDRLEYTWNRLRQIYEQELDRRDYQDKARDGALRDSILNAFEIVPDLTGDFMALLCYFCFEKFDLALLERFTHNKGTTPEQRQKRIPYLMSFLSGERVPETRRREQLVRVEREAERMRRSPERP